MDSELQRLKDTHPLWKDLPWTQDLKHFIQLANFIKKYDTRIGIKHTVGKKFAEPHQGYYHWPTRLIHIIENRASSKLGLWNIPRATITMAHEFGHHLDYQECNGVPEVVRECLVACNKYMESKDLKDLPNPHDYLHVIDSEQRAWELGRRTLLRTEFNNWQYFQQQRNKCMDSYFNAMKLCEYAVKVQQK